MSRLCDDGVQGRDGRCVENSSCFQIFLFAPVCILLLGSPAGLICICNCFAFSQKMTSNSPSEPPHGHPRVSAFWQNIMYTIYVIVHVIVIHVNKHWRRAKGPSEFLLLMDKKVVSKRPPMAPENHWVRGGSSSSKGPLFSFHLNRAYITVYTSMPSNYLSLNGPTRPRFTVGTVGKPSKLLEFRTLPTGRRSPVAPPVVPSRPKAPPRGSSATSPPGRCGRSAQWAGEAGRGELEGW